MTVLRLLVAYDGSAFSGYQVQPERRTVQGALEERMSRLAGGARRTTAAGRTDAGVHALGQVVSVDAWDGPGADVTLRALQATLPSDVTVLDVQEGPDGFDARHSATARSYTYLLWNHPARHPLLRGCTLWVREPVDTGRLAEAVDVVRGVHDFSSFARVREDQTPVREVLDVAVDRDDALVRIHVTASAFLHQMVRSIVGSALEVATGRRSLTWMREALEARDRSAAGPVAPPQGLALARVDYDGIDWPRATDLGWPWKARTRRAVGDAR